MLIVMLMLILIGVYFLFRNNRNNRNNKNNETKSIDVMKNLKMALSEKIIEGFDTNTPTPKPISPLDKFKILLKICQNILGKDMPVLCYNINNIDLSIPYSNKLNRMSNELLQIAMIKALNNENIYDVGALYIAYTNMHKKDIIPIEYDKDGVPSKLKIRAPLPEVLNIMSSKDNDVKNIITNKFPHLLNNTTDILTLKETGEFTYMFGKVLSKHFPMPIDTSKYPPCDNIV